MGFMLFLYVLIFVFPLFTPNKGQHADSCPGSLDYELIRQVISVATTKPESNPNTDFTPSTIYYNCYGNSREPGSYSSLSATLDFQLGGEIRYTQEDFTCVNNEWVASGLATGYSDPDVTPSQSRSNSFSKKNCALCAATDTADEYHCTECSAECRDSISGYPACYGTGSDDCCNLLIGDFCVNSCPSHYSVSATNASICLCADYWTGDQCQTCSLYCLNGAMLREDCSGCSCAPGFSGVSCETEIDYCAPFPCLNNGTCSYDRLGYNCSCMPGFMDRNCSTVINFCYPYPCFNYGICDNSPTGFSCQCQEGTSGPQCQEVDHCFSNPCENNGVCSNFADRYECQCSDGYIGTNCETIDHCYQNMCDNSAVCLNYPDKYECDCAEGFYGQLCQNNVTNCSPTPCLNHGLCTVTNSSEEDGFVCSCHKSSTGRFCEIEIDLCENVTCQNNGSCSTNISQYVCSCEIGFAGRNCEEEIDYCASSPCRNGGTCTFNKFGYNCSCPVSFTGVTCSEMVLFCQPNPCMNNGTCYVTTVGYNCSCVMGYRGDRCEDEIDYCASSPCVRGECLQTAGGHSCVCEAGYTGANCSQLIRECSEGVCLNGGNCTQLEGNFSCQCRGPFTGRQCERIDPDKMCSYLSCENGECNSTRLRTADQSQLRTLLEGQSADSAVTPCECEGHWEGTLCDECSLCENANADCAECDCKGLWSGPDCSECSGRLTSAGECQETEDEKATDNTNIIPIIIPALLGMGGLGSIPFIACLSCKLKKCCKRRRRPKVTVHVVHRDPEKNGTSVLCKRDKTKVKDQVTQQLRTLTAELDVSPTHSIVSEFTSSEKSKQSSELPEYCASGVYDKLTPAVDGHRGLASGAIRFGSQSSGGRRAKLRSPLTSVPDDSELRLIGSFEQSPTRETQGYTNHSDSSSAEQTS